MSIRYTYTATMKTEATIDENGDPVAGTPVTFKCDYQPTVSDTTIKYGGSFVDCKYKLFVSPFATGSSPLSSSGNGLIITEGGAYIMIDGVELLFSVGNEVSCNAVSGIVVAIYPTKLNTEIWVK